MIIVGALINATQCCRKWIINLPTE